MKEKTLFNKVTSGLIISLLIIFSSVSSIQANERPDFSKYKDIKQKKEAFFNFIYPKVAEANKEILLTRKFLQKELVKSNNGKAVTKKNILKISQLCAKYNKPCTSDLSNNISTLLSSIDIVPPSLVLAQAANESSWGTSRFAREGNNYFGQWCYKKGCGLIPKKRNSGAKHEVRKFKNATDSVKAYIFNLNSGKAYATMRKARAAARKRGEKPNGITMANGLTKYSERGIHYIKEIKQMITFNKLVKYDKKFLLEAGLL